MNVTCPITYMYSPQPQEEFCPHMSLSESTSWQPPFYRLAKIQFKKGVK